MKHKILVLFLLLIMLVSSFNVLVMAELELEEEQTIVSSAMTYANVKTKQDVKTMSKDVLEDYSAVFKLEKEYTSEYKDFKRELNDFLEESQEDYEVRKEEYSEEVELLNKRIQTNTKKYNKAVDNNAEKNIDYYQSLINTDNNRLDEVLQIMDDDNDVFMTVQNEVVDQLKEVKKVNRGIKKNKASSKKVKKRFSRISNSYLRVGSAKKKSLKKIVNSANTLNQKLFVLETKCRKQLQYFEEYKGTEDD